MIGLMYLIAAVFYIWLMVVVVRFGWRVGGAKNGSRKRAAAYAFIGFLIVYLPLFWDHIPTLLMHRYYCSKDAGLTVYVSPEQWISDHQNEVDQLKIPFLEEINTGTIYKPGGWSGHLVNRKVLYLNKTEQVGWGRLYVNRSEARLVDANDSVLVKAIGYGYSEQLPSGGLRLWMKTGSCRTGNDYWASFSQIRNSLRLQGNSK